MNTRRIVATGLVAFAAMATGCSDKGGLVGPNMSEEISNLSASTQVDNASANKLEPVPIYYLSLTGTIKRSDLEGGCWYFEADKVTDSERVERYEPDFGGSLPKILVEGQRLLVRGYIQEGRSSICMIGPSLRITNFKAVNSSSSPNGASESAADAPNIAAPVKPASEIILRGILGLTKQGCYSLSSEKEVYILMIGLSVAPDVIGSLVEVTGTWSMTPGSPCGPETPLMVNHITYLAPPATPVCK